jgi:formylglycine-generating enzyme required for sulfatase activity
MLNKVNYLILMSLCLCVCNSYSQPKKFNLAVGELEARGISGMDALVVSDFLREALVNTKVFTVLERSNMETILNEQKFQMSGCTTEECAVQLGHLLNVEKVIVGSVSKLGNGYIVSIREIDIEKGDIELADSETTDSLEKMLDACTNLANRLAFGNKVQKTIANENMVLISAGDFIMGSEEGGMEERPVHTVYLDAFYIDKYEVTNDQYALFIATGGYNNSEYWTKDGWAWKVSNDISQPKYWTHVIFGYKATEGPNLPVVGVSWYEAYAYAKWAGKRLPTEAEWEKVCRADKTGSNIKYSFGNTESTLGDYAWYSKNAGMKTHPVGQKNPSNLGIYDMHGNAWEWCNDWFQSDYYSKSPTNNPQGTWSGIWRVLRGSSWNGDAANCRSAARGKYYPSIRNYYIGFRCALSVTK